ncbi:hypothetical protein SRM1_02454 [Pseudomonas fluorescens]|nr:hypothetical protein SRM1_02454 [Pseudomonas fluorescens]
MNYGLPLGRGAVEHFNLLAFGRSASQGDGGFDGSGTLGNFIPARRAFDGRNLRLHILHSLDGIGAHRERYRFAFIGTAINACFCAGDQRGEVQFGDAEFL